MDRRSGSVVRASRVALTALCDAILPADDYPSASEAGAISFLEKVVAEKPEWEQRIAKVVTAADGEAVRRFGRRFSELEAEERTAVVDGLLGDEDYDWLARLVNAGYYSDPVSGGNDDASSWRMLGWSPGTDGAERFEWRPSPGVFVGPADVLARYDAIVIGSGAGGGVAACGLAESGRSVLVVEAGTWPSSTFLGSDHLHNPRSFFGLESFAGPPDRGNPRVLELTDRRQVLEPSDLRWNNNAVTVGGGTRVYGAQAWRFGPDDFAMASRYGVPEGSALADWPIGYEELEPYYSRAEWELGVCGGTVDGLHSGPRSKPYPMAPLPTGRGHALLQGGAEQLGYSTVSVPLLVNSKPYLGRPACVQCAMCVGFACPVDAKNTSANTMLARAFATGRCSILVEARVARLETDGRGRVMEAIVVGRTPAGGRWRQRIAASEFIVAGGAVESARLLLNSATEGEPAGLGNNADQVGRHLQGHVTLGAVGIFDDIVEELIGPGPSIATVDFRHGNDGVIGGGIIVNEFPTTPSNTYRSLVEAGLLAEHGLGSKQGMRELGLRMMKLYAPIQEVTNPESRVRIDPAVTDDLGIPVARLSGGLHPEDIKARDYLAARAEDWLRASGARTIGSPSRGVLPGPSGGQHQAGTCRMGDDPRSSVTDRWGRVWGHDNLRVVDGALHVTNGGVNPVLTIFANAMRITDHLTRA